MRPRRAATAITTALSSTWTTRAPSATVRGDPPFPAATAATTSTWSPGRSGKPSSVTGTATPRVPSGRSAATGPSPPRPTRRWLTGSPSAMADAATAPGGRLVSVPSATRAAGSRRTSVSCPSSTSPTAMARVATTTAFDTPSWARALGRRSGDRVDGETERDGDHGRQRPVGERARARAGRAAGGAGGAASSARMPAMSSRLMGVMRERAGRGSGERRRAGIRLPPRARCRLGEARSG